MKKLAPEELETINRVMAIVLQENARSDDSPIPLIIRATVKYGKDAENPEVAEGTMS